MPSYARAAARFGDLTYVTLCMSSPHEVINDDGGQQICVQLESALFPVLPWRRVSARRNIPWELPVSKVAVSN